MIHLPVVAHSNLPVPHDPAAVNKHNQITSRLADDTGQLLSFEFTGKPTDDIHSHVLNYCCMCANAS